MVNDMEKGDRAEPNPFQQHMTQAISSIPGFVTHIMWGKELEIHHLRMALGHARSIIDLRREEINNN